VQLKEINHIRRGHMYVEAKAAMAICCQLIASNEGYWTYKHLAIQ
jgi:hypothetical protein